MTQEELQFAETGVRCLEPDALFDFSTGRMTDDRLTAVAAHLSDCGRCADQYRRMVRESSDDLIFAHLRRPEASPPNAQEPAYAVMEAAAKQFGRNSDLDFEARTLPRGQTYQHPRPVPRVIGPYSVRAVLGHGGMGVVYAAVHKVLNRPVALKMIRDEGTASDATLARFWTEGEAIARLQHPNIIHVQHFDEWEGRPYIAMELLDGGSLAERLRNDGPMPPRAAAELTRTLAVAVQFAHDQRVLHRDLKPGNVLMAGDGTLKIVDFGLAKLLDEDRRGVTHSDIVIGTPSYMAPEQASGRTADVGPGSDVYALGAILYECLTGKPPFLGENKIQTLELVIRESVVPPSVIRPNVPPELEAICLKCLEKNQSFRYASAQNLVDDLGRWLAGKPTVARPPFLGVRTRKFLRRFALLSIPVGMVAGGSMAAVWSDPERPLRAINADLEQGKPVTLIGETGMPVRVRVLTGDKSSSSGLGPDGTFQVRTSGYCAVELIPDSKWDSYRFRVQIRHESAGLGGHVAAYVAGHPMAKYPASSIVCTRLNFDDVLSRLDVPRVVPKAAMAINQLKENAAHVGVCMAWPGFAAETDTIGYTVVDVARFLPNRGAEDGWRTVQLDARPTGVTGYIAGQSETAPAESLTKTLSVMRDGFRTYPHLKDIDPFDPKHHTRGGIGIMVQKGTASFRSAVLEPLTE